MKKLLIASILISMLLVACTSPATQPAKPTLAPQAAAATATKAPATNLTSPALSATPAASSSGKPAAPAPYAGKTNPLSGNASAIAAGRIEFSTNCVSCHGEKADGAGNAANLLQTVKTESEAYMFWRISEGGRIAPFNSRMQTFKDRLTETQIWQVISYLQTLK